MRAVRRNLRLSTALSLLVTTTLTACSFGSLDSLDSDYGDASAPADAGRQRQDATLDGHVTMHPDATLESGRDALPECGPAPDCAAGCLIPGNGAPTALLADDGGVFFASQENGAIAIFAATEGTCQLPVQVLSEADAGGETISDLGADATGLFWILRSANGSRLFRAPRPVGSALLSDPQTLASVTATLGPLVVGDLVYAAYTPAKTDGGSASPGIYAYFKDGGLSGEGPSGSACNLTSGHPIDQMSYRDETLYWTLGAQDDRSLVQEWSEAPGCKDETDNGATPFPFGIVATSAGLFWLQEPSSRDGGIFTPQEGGVPRRVLQIDTSMADIIATNVAGSRPGYLTADDQFFYWYVTNGSQVSYAARNDAGTQQRLFSGSNHLVAPIYSVGQYVYLATQGGVVKVNRPSL